MRSVSKKLYQTQLTPFPSSSYHCVIKFTLFCCSSPQQLSFQMWTSRIQETLNSRKCGDAAFRAKDFTTAINCYTEVSKKIPSANMRRRKRASHHFTFSVTPTQI